MPQFFGNKVGVFKHELIGDGLFPSYGALKLKLWRDEEISWGIKRIKKGGYGRKLIVDYDTLPKHYQDLLTDPRKAKHPLLAYYFIEKETRAYYQDYTYPDGSHLLPETIAQLIIDASVLKALQQLEVARRNERIAKGGSLRNITKTLFEDAHTFNETLVKEKKTPHTLNTSYKHFRKQYVNFKEGSYFTIIKDPFGKSKKNAQKRDEALEQLLRNLMAGQGHKKPTATSVAREYEAFLAGYVDVINKDTGEVYQPKEFKTISKRTITQFLATWDVKVGTDAKRVGADRQGLINDYITHHSFEPPKMAGSMISIDDRQPPFHYNANGDRMWWYIGIDLASEAIVAWAYGKTKKELILNFYKNIVSNHFKWNLNLPAEVECESSLNSSYTDSFLKEGAMFEYVTMYRNMARSKKIERFFRELRYGEEFEKSKIGWLARPFAKSESNQAGPKLPKNADGSDPNIIPYDTLVKQCLSDIVKWNNMPKKGTKTGRFDYFLQNQNPDLIETNYKSFIKDLGTSRTSTVKKGIVKLDKSEWLLGDKNKIYTGEKLITLLKKVERKSVQTYFLNDGKGNILKAFAYDIKDGRFLCELLPKPKYQKSKKEKTDADKKAAEIMSRYVNTVAIYQRTQKQSIESVEVIKNKTATVSNSFTMDAFDLEIEKTDVEDAPIAPQTATVDADDYDDYEDYNYNPANDL